MSITHPANRPTVPCGLCGTPTAMTGTKRCDPCWELERRVKMDPVIAHKVLSELQMPPLAPQVLLQDEAEGRGLSRALASKPDAKLHAREAAGGIVPAGYVPLPGKDPIPVATNPAPNEAQPFVPSPTVKVTINAKSTMALSEAMRAAIEAERQPGGALHRPTAALKPCRSPYCECEPGKCTHPGFFDARGTTERRFTEDERLHLDQAAEYLRDYGMEQARLGNNSTANGCDASAFVLRRMLFPDAAAPAATDAASPAATDAALDLVELPPIRVNRETYESLKVLGLQRGMILQPLVREAIQRMLAQPGLLTDPQVATILAQHRAPPTDCGAKLHDWAMAVVRTVAATLAGSIVDPDGDGWDGIDSEDLAKLGLPPLTERDGFMFEAMYQLLERAGVPDENYAHQHLADHLMLWLLKKPGRREVVEQLMTFYGAATGLGKSVWETVEMSAAARSFDWENYRDLHRKSNCKGSLLCREAYTHLCATMRAQMDYDLTAEPPVWP